MSSSLDKLCIPYAIIGYYSYLKNETKTNKRIKKVQVKRHTINENETDPNYSQYHYYMEIDIYYEFNNKTYKYILDNEFAIHLVRYKRIFKPKNIVKLKEKEIKKEYDELCNNYNVRNFLEIIKDDIDKWLLFLSVDEKDDMRFNIPLTEIENNYQEENKDYNKRYVRTKYLEWSI